MKNFNTIGLLLAICFFATGSFAQPWKQYADSAKIFQEQKKPEQAIEFYLKSIEALKRDSLGTLTYASFCDILGRLYKDKGEYPKAEYLYLEVKQIRGKVLGKEDYRYARACYSLGSLYRYMAQNEKSEQHFLEAMEIQERLLGKEHGDYLVSCTGLANLYRSKRQYDKAEKLYLEALQGYKKSIDKDPQDYASCCNSLANLYLSTNQNEKALPLFLQAMEIQETRVGKGNLDYAQFCNNLGCFYYNTRQLDLAEPLLLEAKRLRDSLVGKDHPDYARSCQNLGRLYTTKARYDTAEALYQEAKLIYEKKLGRTHPDYATACDDLATLYQKTGQYEKVELLLLETTPIREVSGKDNLAYAATCSRRASLYQSIGQYEQAELLHLKAKQIRERLQGRNDPDYAACCDNLALLYMAKGQYWKAEPLFIEAKQIREKKLGKNNYDYAASCDNLALLYMDWEKYDKSEALFVESKQINEALGKSHPNYASSCNNLARLYQCTGKYPQAEQLYKEAKQIWEKAFGQYHPKYAIACGNLANLYRLMGQPFLAQKEFEAAFAAKSYNLTHVFQFTNEKEKAAYIKNISGGDESAFSFYLSERIKSGHPYSLSLFHRNLILSASQALRAQLLSSEDTNIINKYNEWVRLKKILAVQYSRPVAERDGDLAETEGRAGRLEKALTRLSSSFAKQQRHVDWTDIRARLKSDEAAIEFVSFRLKNGKFRTDTVLYLALILRKDSLLPAMVSLFNEKELQHLLPDAGNKPTKEGAIELYTLGGPDSEVDNKPVYELTWKPLEKELIGINTIYFAPSGLLHRIAFAALPVNSTQVLSDKYKLIQLATTASVADQQPSFITASDKIQLYGDISYNADTSELKNEAVAYNYAKSNDRSFPADSERRGSWPQLPGTKKELEAIVSRSGEYKSKITSLSGINATEESLKALDGKASPGLIHIATHGFFFTNQEKDSKQQEGTIESGHVFKSSNDPLMRSGLLFAGANHAWQNKPIKGIDDGILTAYEVANFYLPNTKLVVLSACETALGDIQGNEGVYGLQRAFKIAGVQNLVMSLWKVPDGKTPEFMQEFYKNMFAKQAISDAFYNAQKVMKDKYRSQPVNWAAWVLVR